MEAELLKGLSDDSSSLERARVSFVSLESGLRVKAWDMSFLKLLTRSGFCVESRTKYAVLAASLGAVLVVHVT